MLSSAFTGGKERGRKKEEDEEEEDSKEYKTLGQPSHILAKLNYSQYIFVYFKLKIDR